jgi:hypothetical protein
LIHDGILDDVQLGLTSIFVVVPLINPDESAALAWRPQAGSPYLKESHTGVIFVMNAHLSSKNQQGIHAASKAKRGSRLGKSSIRVQGASR